MSDTRERTAHDFAPLTPESQDRRAPGATSTWTDSPLFSSGMKVVTLVSAIGGAVGLFAGTLGMRLWGPHDDIAVVRIEMARRDSVASARFVNIEGGASTMTSRIQGLEDGMRMQSYILCVYVRRNDPAAAPPGCAPIVSRGAP